MIEVNALFIILTFPYSLTLYPSTLSERVRPYVFVSLVIALFISVSNYNLSKCLIMLLSANDLVKG